MSDYLTGDQVAELLNISRRTLYRWMKRGKLAADEWTAERVAARRDDLFQRARPDPHCPCGATDPALFSPNRARPSGYSGNCRRCNAARMWRARQKAAS